MTDALPAATDLAWLTAAEAGRLMAAKKLSPVEYAQALIARTETLEPRLDAYISFTPELMLAMARAAETEMLAGISRGPLHGVPVALKDIIDTAGITTTCHSKILQHAPPATGDALVWRRLKAGGTPLSGKTSTHEFAIGGPSFDLPWPPARNPWNPKHHPGGSSSGSGAALGAGMVALALGTDTGGSVRNPASMCGIVGLKPTYGLVSRAGVFPLSFSLDHVGPMTRTVEDNALLLRAIAGHDASDPASVLRPHEDFSRDLHRGVKGLRIALVDHFHTTDEPAEPEMAAAIARAATLLSDAGAVVDTVTLPSLIEFGALNRTVLLSEAYAIHEQWLRQRPGDYAQSTRRRLLPGAFLSAPDYVQAQRRRRQVTDAVSRVFDTHDAILCASSMDPAAVIDDTAEVERTYPRQARTPFNLTGHPALALGIDLHTNGLPLAVQLVTAHFAEAMLYRVAWALEQAAGFVGRRPNL
jgi:aspartyl-tRNA(Asn)/glutamyl-tRNA(Gln) amidotransferase subunit A